MHNGTSLLPRTSVHYNAKYSVRLYELNDLGGGFSFCLPRRTGRRRLSGTFFTQNQPLNINFRTRACYSEPFLAPTTTKFLTTGDALLRSGSEISFGAISLPLPRSSIFEQQHNIDRYKTRSVDLGLTLWSEISSES